MNIQHIRETVTRFGLNAAVQNMACRAASKVTDVMLLKGLRLTMETVDPSFLREEAGYRWGFLDRHTLQRAVARGASPAAPMGAEMGMDAAFVDAAFARGDRCYGALDGETIAAYGWYSTKPTAVTAIADDMVLFFDSSHAYMYRGYTLPAYRGQRLHGIGMARAMKAHVEEGLAGLVSVVESNNLASLASCQRLGYRQFGQLLCVKVSGRYVTFATKGCEPYGFRVSRM